VIEYLCVCNVGENEKKNLCMLRMKDEE